MAELQPCIPGNSFKEAVCINVNRIYDTCREHDCAAYNI